MRLIWFAHLLAAMLLTVEAVRKPNAKYRRLKPINWNLSYYTEPFKLCKPLRVLNPVERMKAHGEAVDVFRSCGPRLVVPHATRYNFPAFGKFSSELAELGLVSLESSPLLLRFESHLSLSYEHSSLLHCEFQR